ncbi:unnamed protein product [Alopecurus aequalis]
MSREDRPAEFTVCLPDGRPINAYTDTHGRVVTRDGSAPGGPPRLFHDLFMEAVPRSRRRDGPQPPRLPDSLVVPNSARELQESDVFYSEQLLDTISLKESSVTTTSSSSPQAVAVAHDTIEVSPPSGRLSLGSPILSRIPYGWHLVFFIGIDRGGSFHIYPHIGGPYQSLEDADNAITCHLDDRREKNVCLDGLSRMEINVRRALYLPDGTRRKLSKSYTAQESHKNTCLLVQALLDKSLHMNSKMSYAYNQFVRGALISGTIISISLQGPKEKMCFTVASTVCSLLKSHVLEEHIKSLRSAVSTCLSLTIMVTAVVVQIMEVLT